jgi:simple sugar transport system ATP-binding protein
VIPPQTEGSTTDVVLALTNIRKRFGNSIALDDVSLRVTRGTVHALVGENGAGKTTLMRIAFGLTRADAGRVMAAGTTRAITSPTDAIGAGIGMVHQHFSNVPAMTVAENAAIGGRGRFAAASAAARVIEIGLHAGLELDPHARVESLTVGAQQRLEIVKALTRRARILILDEPTAVLVPAEAEQLLRWLRQFADQGNAVVLITHKLDEALAVADVVTVLRRGRVVLDAVAGALNPRGLATALLGEELSSEPQPAPMAPLNNIVVSVKHADLTDERGVTVLRDVDVEVRAGEIVGVAGVEGAGQRQLLRVLARRADARRGEIRLPPAVGFVPEDRQRDALVLDFTLAENVALKGAAVRRGLMRWREVERLTRTLVRDLDVRGEGTTQSTRALSGGNQQKLILARELDDSPRLLVVENPTRGLDIRATQAVHERLRAAARSGAAVVLYSSDLDEVLQLATRVFVLHAARLRECALDRDAVGRAMLGVA